MCRQFNKISIFIRLTLDMQNYLALGLKGKNQWWRYVISVILIFVFLVIVGYIPVELYIDSGDFSGFSSEEIQEILDDDNFLAAGLNQSIGLLTMISGFIFGLIVLFLCYKFIHKKQILHLVNVTKKTRWKHVFFGFGVWAVLFVISTFTDMLVHTDDYQFTFEWNRFYPLLLVCLFFLPFQVAFEEFFLRGYVMQGLYNVLPIPAFSIILSSLFFAALHMSNPEVEAFGWYIMMPYYIGSALMFGILTVWDEGIEIAMGVHLANNILLALTVSYEDAVLQVDSIWTKAENHINGWNILIYFSMFFITLYASHLFISKTKKNIKSENV